jgi:hypothetical protein
LAAAFNRGTASRASGPTSPSARAGHVRRYNRRPDLAQRPGPRGYRWPWAATVGRARPQVQPRAGASGPPQGRVRAGR